MAVFAVTGNVSVKLGNKFVVFPVEGKIVAGSVNEAAGSESMRILLLEAAKKYDKKATGRDVLGPRFCPEKGMTRGLMFTANKYLHTHESLPGWFLVRFLPGLTLGIVFAIYNADNTPETIVWENRCEGRTRIASFIVNRFSMTDSNNLSAAANVLASFCLIVAEQKPQTIESFLVRRGTFATIDFPLTYTRFEQRAEEYARSCAVVKEDILMRTDAYLSTGKRVRLADIVSGVVNGMGVQPDDVDFQAKKEYVEQMILKYTSDNDCENRYHWIKRGKNAGLCAWKFKD